MTPQRIIWHHSADMQDAAQAQRINAHHHKLGFPVSSLGYWIGYHWLIERDGTMFQARREDEIGAHDTGENSNSIGICLAGNFNYQTPTEAQTAAVARLVSDIRKRWNIPITRIEPHRWDDVTDCPGKLLPDNWLARVYLEREGEPLVRLFAWLGDTYQLL